MGNPRTLYAYRVLLYKGKTVVRKKLAQTNESAERIQQDWMAEHVDDDHRAVIVGLDTLAPADWRRRDESLHVGEGVSPWVVSSSPVSE